MINLFDNVNLTGNRNLKPVEKMNEILNVLTFPAEAEEEQKLSEPTFSCFRATLNQWVLDHCLYPMSITNLIQFLEKPRDWNPWQMEYANMNFLWTTQLFNELIFLLIQYLLYKEFMYKKNKSSQSSDYQVLGINQVKLKGNIANVQARLLPFFYSGKAAIDSPLDILTTSVVYASSALKRNLLYSLTKQPDNTFQDINNFIIQWLSILPVTQEKATIVSQQLLKAHPYVSSNDRNKKVPQFFYTPSLLCQYENFIIGRIFNLHFLDISACLWNKFAINKYSNIIQHGWGSIVQELLCSPFLQFRVDILCTYGDYLVKNSELFYASIIKFFLDFLKKLHYITLPAFLLKGECLYNHLNTTEKIYFFEEADSWLDSQEKMFNNLKARDIAITKLYYPQNDFNSLSCGNYTGKPMLYTKKELLERKSWNETILNTHDYVLSYLQIFFDRMNKITKKEYATSYFESLKKERPYSIMSSVKSSWYED